MLARGAGQDNTSLAATSIVVMTKADIAKKHEADKAEWQKRGVFGIISAVRAIRRKEDRWGLLIFEGLVNIAVGIAAFLWPGLTVVAFMWLIAAWAIVTGGLMTAAGFRLNIDHGRWWLIWAGYCLLPLACS